MSFFFNGKRYDIPGVYSVIKVIQNAGANLPDFNVGLIIGKSLKGAPYNSSSEIGEIIRPYSDPTALARDYGHDEIYNNFKEAQGTGAGVIFVLNSQPNTPSKVTLKDDTPADSIDINVESKNYGIFGNDIKLSITETASDEQLDNGIATAGAATTITDTGKTWGVNAYADKWVSIIKGTGKGQVRKVVSNTATVITVSSAWTVNPSTDSEYLIVEPSFQFTITPTKNEKLITQDISNGSYFCYVNSPDGLSPGIKSKLMNNPDGLISEHEIGFVDHVFNSAQNGYKVIFKTPISSANATTANYARLVQDDDAISVSFTGSEWNLENIISQVNLLQDHLVLSKSSGATKTPDTLTENVIGQIAGATLGTSPAVTLTDYINISDNMQLYSKEFSYLYRINIRHINVATSNTSVYPIFKSVAATLRNDINKKPVQVILGTASGQTVTELVTLAKSLNDDHMILCGGGLNGKASYLSFAPQIFGLLITNDVKHNLTRDLINAVQIENEWSYEDLSTLTKSGVLTYQAHKNGYRVTQGINTYQDHEHNWNEQDKKTWLIWHRQLADFFNAGMTEELEALIGQDDVIESRLIGFLNVKATTFIQNGYIEEFRINEIRKVELGWRLEHSIILPGLTDFIGQTINVLTGLN